jgi:hypothetical protein
MSKLTRRIFRNFSDFFYTVPLVRESSAEIGSVSRHSFSSRFTPTSLPQASCRSSGSGQIGFVFTRQYPRTFLISLSFQGTWNKPAPVEIGFVLRICPRTPSADRGHIGFVLHISLPGRARHTITVVAHIPHPTHIWLRFAQFPPSAASGGTELGSFRTIGHPEFTAFRPTAAPMARIVESRRL